MSRRHLVAYISLCVIWGSTWLAIRVAVRDLPPFLACALRFALAAVILFAWVIFRRLPWPRDARQWNAIVLLGFTMLAIPYGLLFWAEQYVTSSLTAILFSALPLIVALLTPLMLHRTVPRAAVLAMVVASGGLLILFYTDLQFGSRAFWGGVLLFVGMFLTAWSIVYAKLRLEEIHPAVSTLLQLVVAAAALFWATWALESHHHPRWTRSAIYALLFLGTLGSAAAMAIYYWLLQHMEAYKISALNLVFPIVAVLEGSLIAHEPVPFMMIVAMVVVLGSVGVVLKAESEIQPKILTADPE